MQEQLRPVLVDGVHLMPWRCSTSSVAFGLVRHRDSSVQSWLIVYTWCHDNALPAVLPSAWSDTETALSSPGWWCTPDAVAMLYQQCCLRLGQTQRQLRPVLVDGVHLMLWRCSTGSVAFGLVRHRDSSVQSWLMVYTWCHGDALPAVLPSARSDTETALSSPGWWCTSVAMSMTYLQRCLQLGQTQRQLCPVLVHAVHLLPWQCLTCSAAFSLVRHKDSSVQFWSIVYTCCHVNNLPAVLPSTWSDTETVLSSPGWWCTPVAMTTSYLQRCLQLGQT